MPNRNPSLKSLMPGVIMIFTLLVAFTGDAFSQNSATATANASAVIVTPLQISNTAAMLFGQVAAGTAAGTVVLETTGNRSVTGGTKLGTGTGQAASFNVTGESGYTYNITLPSSVNLTFGSNTMAVGSFTSNPSGSGTLTGGSSTLKVGATLSVGASQAAGTYTGTFDVTVAYP